VLNLATGSPRLAAVLAASGALRLLLRTNLAAEGAIAHLLQAGHVVALLHGWAAEAFSERGGSSHVLELLNLERSVFQFMAAMGHLRVTGDAASISPALLDSLCQQAATVASALLRHWARQQDEEAVQLELALACTARACAYLRCANLGRQLASASQAADGGGSKKCRSVSGFRGGGLQGTR